MVTSLKKNSPFHSQKNEQDIKTNNLRKLSYTTINLPTSLLRGMEVGVVSYHFPYTRMATTNTNTVA